MIYLFKENENYFIKNDETNEAYQLIKCGRNKRENDENISDEDLLFDWAIPQFEGHNIQKSINKYKLKNYLLNNEKLILNEKDEKLSNEKTQNYSRKSSKVEKWSWLDYATDDEKKKLEEIKNNCIKRHDDQVNDPKYQLLQDRKKILEMLANVDAKLNEITKKDEVEEELGL